MQKKRTSIRKLISASLCLTMMTPAAISAVPMSVSAVNNFGSLGIVGSFTDWGESVADIPMTDDDGDGIYEARFSVSARTHEFKVRANNDWQHTWGVYEDDYERTYNSQTNCKIECSEGDVLLVQFDTNGSDYEIWPISYKVINKDAQYFGSFGIVGTLTGWGSKTDIPLTDNDGDGIYEATVTGLSSGTHEFKVRADSDWQHTWGEYEEDYDRTYNSQTNLSVNIKEGDVLTVKFDTKGDDYELWPVSVSVNNNSDEPVIDAAEGVATKLKILDENGKDLGDDPIIYLDTSPAAQGITSRTIKAVASDNNGNPVRDQIRCFFDTGYENCLDTDVEGENLSGEVELKKTLRTGSYKQGDHGYAWDGNCKPGSTRVHFTTASGEVYRTVTVVVYEPATDMKVFWGSDKVQLPLNDENMMNAADIMVIANHQYQFTAEKVPTSSTDKAEWLVYDGSYEGSGTPSATNKAEITDNGLFTPKSNGTVTIVAKYKATETSPREMAFGTKKVNGETLSNVQNVPKYIHVTIVKENPAKSLSITNYPQDNAMQVGETFQLGYQAVPSYTGAGYESGATDVFTWKSSNPKVAAVDEKGLVTAVGKGDSKITIYGENENVRAEIDLKVLTKATSINFNSQTMSTRVGVETPVTAIMSPDTADEEIIWTSSNESIAVVQSISHPPYTNQQTAVVTGIKKGIVKITARAKSSGVEKTITCNVNEKINADDIHLSTQNGTVITTIYDGSTVNVYDQKQIKIDGILQAADGSTPDDSLVWEVLDNGVNNGDYVTIDSVTSSSIVLTGFARGKVRVKASSVANPSLSKTFYVQILKRATKGTIINLASDDGKFKTSLNVGSTLSLGTDLTIDTNQPYAHDDKVVKWVSNKPEIISITNTGFVNVLGNGSARLTFTTDSGLTGSTTITGFTTSSIVIRNVTLVPDSLPRIDVVLSKDMAAEKALSATVRNEKDTTVSNAAITWTSSDERIATINSDGKLTAKNVGDTIITAKSGNKTDQCIVHVAYSISNAVINIEPIFYNPYYKEYTPDVEVIVPGGTDIWGEPLDDVVLVEGEDYTKEYSNNTALGLSSAVTITGINKYTSTTKKSFKINPKPVTAEDVICSPIEPIEITMENKSGVKPDPVITYLGYQLVNGKDYTVSYASNTKPGNGIVTVTAKANFTGKLTITFEIFCSHTETTQTVKTKPTCISTGINTVKCSVCGYTWEEETPAGGHTVRVTERVEPKCTEDGYEKGKCSVCNEIVTTVLPATGHNIVYHDAKAPTEDEVGWEAYETCSKCDYTTYKEIPAIFTNRSTISTEQTLVGQEVTLNGIGHGGVEPYTYAFVYKAPEATSWKVIGTKFGTSDTEKLTPTKEGSYEIMITIKDGTGKSAAKKFTLDVIDGRLKNTSSIDAEGNEVPCGTKITITGAAQGGTGPYLFTYQIKKPGKDTWTTIGDKYAADTSKVFTTKLSGKYEVRVLVKDSEGTVKSYSTEVESKGNLLENVSTISASDVKVGESVTLTALPKEGTAPYRYTYEYKKPGAASWKTIGKRGATYKSVNFTTDTTGTYQARIYIQDASNYVTVKTFKVKVS